MPKPDNLITAIISSHGGADSTDQHFQYVLYKKQFWTKNILSELQVAEYEVRDLKSVKGRRLKKFKTEIFLCWTWL
jgi:hypothetical protein